MLIGCPYPIERRPPFWWRFFVLPAGLGTVMLASALTLRGPSAMPGLTEAPSHEPKRTLRLDRLTVAVDPSSDEDLECVLPIPLPPAYELDFEIFARRMDLPLHQVAGYRIIPEMDEGSWSAEDERELWHRIRLAVGAVGSAVAWVDGQEAKTRRVYRPVTGRLAMRLPPGKVCRLRNLALTWTPIEPDPADAILAIRPWSK